MYMFSISKVLRVFVMLFATTLFQIFDRMLLRAFVALFATTLFLIFDRMLCRLFLLIKYFLNDKEHFYSRQTDRNPFPIGRNVFLGTRKLHVYGEEKKTFVKD